MNPYMSSNDNQPQNSSSGFAVASMVLGISGFVAWCLPLIGYPVTIVGLVLGIVALNKGTSGKGMAIAGVVMCSITLILTLLNSILGAVMNVFDML